MKLFCAYAFTGEDLNEITKRMQLVVDSLNANKHQAYCNLFDASVEKLYADEDIKGIFNAAFAQIKGSDALVAIISSPNRSIGQIMEIGTALSNNKLLYLLEHVTAKDTSYLPRLASKHYAWNTDEELAEALKQI